MSEPVLVVDKVSHRFGERWVLEDISLEVHAGEIMAIMGSSGGGKSTLLKIMSGLLVPTEGDVRVAGISSKQNPEEVRQKLGLVFQSAALFDYLNVQDNVRFGLERQAGLARSEVQSRTEETLEEVGLSHALKLLPNELSGGMRKRVGLARALVMEPEVILYDEPTSGLDPVTAYAIDQLIVETRDARRVTSLVVSHDVSSVFRVADRVAFLDAGKLAYVGELAGFRDIRTGSIGDLVQKARAEAFL